MSTKTTISRVVVAHRLNQTRNYIKYLISHFKANSKWENLLSNFFNSEMFQFLSSRKITDQKINFLIQLNIQLTISFLNVRINRVFFHYLYTEYSIPCHHMTGDTENQVVQTQPTLIVLFWINNVIIFKNSVRSPEVYALTKSWVNLITVLRLFRWLTMYIE